MVLLWPLAGEELKRIQREALDPVVVTQLRKVQHLKPLGRGRWRRPPRSQQAVEEAEARDAVLRRVEPLRWSVKRGEALRMVMEAKVSRKKVALEVDCGSDTTLNFGDAVRVVLPGLGEDTISTCLSACVRPGATSQVGFRGAQAADASFEERRLAKDLASWGRRAYDFVALSCAPMEDAILRRSAWTVYRANVMDAFQGPKVHYGQHLMLGQPEAAEVPTKELLLSCEPPSRCTQSLWRCWRSISTDGSLLWLWSCFNWKKELEHCLHPSACGWWPPLGRWSRCDAGWKDSATGTVLVSTWFLCLKSKTLIHFGCFFWCILGL